MLKNTTAAVADAGVAVKSRPGGSEVSWTTRLPGPAVGCAATSAATPATAPTRRRATRRTRDRAMECASRLTDGSGLRLTIPEPPAAHKAARSTEVRGRAG